MMCALVARQALSARHIAREGRRSVDLSSSAKESTNIISLVIDGVGRDRRADLDHPAVMCDSLRRDVTGTLCQTFLQMKKGAIQGGVSKTSTKKEQDTNNTPPLRSVVVRQKQQSTERNVDDAVDSMVAATEITMEPEPYFRAV